MQFGMIEHSSSLGLELAKPALIVKAPLSTTRVCEGMFAGVLGCCESLLVLGAIARVILDQSLQGASNDCYLNRAIMAQDVLSFSFE